MLAGFGVGPGLNAGGGGVYPVGGTVVAVGGCAVNPGIVKPG